MPADWSECAELEWISRDRLCRQQVAWFGNLARNPGQRAATVLRRGERRTLFGSADEPVQTAKEIGQYLYEPDAAVLAARLTGTAAGEHSLQRVAPGIAYLTGDARFDDLAMDGFAVLDVLPFRPKALKLYLQKREIGRVEIKKRGVDCDPQRLSAQLASGGDGEATLIITRRLGKSVAIVARRLQPPINRPTQEAPRS